MQLTEFRLVPAYRQAGNAAGLWPEYCTVANGKDAK